jgi:hypothetical protein
LAAAAGRHPLHAKRQTARRLVLIPPLPSSIAKRLFVGDAKRHYKGQIAVGEDGMMIFLPLDSDRIEIKNVLR